MTAGLVFDAPYFSHKGLSGKLFKYMRLSSLSDSRKVPRAWLFIALLGLLLTAAVVFTPNSRAGHPVIQAPAAENQNAAGRNLFPARRWCASRVAGR